MYGWRNLADETITHRVHHICRCVEERHCAVNADTYIHAIHFGYTDNMLHVFECVPWRKAEH